MEAIQPKAINIIGQVLTIRETSVEVLINEDTAMPRIGSHLVLKDGSGTVISLEVIEQYNYNIVTCLPMDAMYGVTRGAEVYYRADHIYIPQGKSVLGRVISPMGDPLDGLESIEFKHWQPTNNEQIPLEDVVIPNKIMKTGIKAIDIMCPILSGSRSGILGGAGVGKSVVMLEMMHNTIGKDDESCAIFSGIGERIREGQELINMTSQSNIKNKISFILGSMDKSPGLRYRTAWATASIAQSLHRLNQNVILFIDNIYRFSLAGNEISGSMGAMSSYSGYQPGLAQEMDIFENNLNSSKQYNSTITSLQAVYLPSDDVSDPAACAVFCHLDSVLVLSRRLAQQGIYPAIDVLSSSSNAVENVDIVGATHYKVAKTIRRYLQNYELLKDLVNTIGIDELQPEDKIKVLRARKLIKYFSQPFFSSASFTNMPGKYVELNEGLKDCHDICCGHYDHISEDQFYMIGKIEF